MLVARSVAEAHLYMDLHGCEPGSRGHALEARGDELVAVYRTRARGEPMTFEFVIPEPMPAGGGFGGAAPSSILGPGDFLAHADQLAKSVPATADGLGPEQRAEAHRRLSIAARCLDEIVKFVPPGEDRVPDAAFRSPRDLALKERERGRFSRARLEAVAAAYRSLLGRFA